VLTWRATIPIGVGVLLLITLQRPAWGIAAVVLTALLVALDIGLAAGLRPVALSRDGDRQVRLDETATVRLTVANNGTRALRGQVRDAWVPSAGAAREVTPVEIPPGTAVDVVTVLTPIRRGDRPAVRVSLRSFGPMGLGYRQTTVKRAAAITPRWTLRVLPRFASRRFLPEKVARLRVLDGITVTRGRGQGTEFDTLREYVDGDDVRSIDWRASARRSDVVVRTWRPERDRRVLCVIDTGRTSAARVGDEPRLDAAIDAALLLGALANRAGDRVDLLAIDTAVRAAVDNGSSRTLLPRLVAALAPLQPALVETDFGLVTSEVLRRERKRALVVLFTALEPGALAEGLLPVLTLLTVRHKVVVAAVHDPALVDLTAGRGAAGALYAAAAAHRALAERDRIRAALERRGVEVVDAPVELFASKVSDAYLAMKAAGRL
jgi:uncharacterized protein (DUF58 family)